MSYSRFLITTISTLAVSAYSANAATDVDPNAPVTRAQFSALLKETLLNDPTILMEVVEKMQSDQQEEMNKKAKEGILTNKDALFSDKNSPTIGPDDADVTIVEFFDYHCGYCKQALTTISKLVETDKKVKVVFKEYPILSDDSRYAAKAALSVYRLDKKKYFDFHRAMYEVKGTITEAVVMAQASKLGIDEKKLKAEIANPEIEKLLNKNHELGAAIGARGTPAIIIGDKLFPGAVPLEAMQKAIADVRTPAKK